MTNLIINLFIKNKDDVKNPTVRGAYGRVSGIVGIVSNILLFLLKFIVGTVFNSVSVVADALNNLSDSASSLITIIGFKLSSKPADKEHPYGHARYEYLSGVLVSFLIMILGLGLIQTAITEIANPKEISISTVLVISLVISIVIKFWQYLFYKKIAKTIDSNTVKATSFDSRNDVIITMGVLVAAVISHYINFNLDPYIGLVVAVFIFISGVKLVIDTGNPLIGQAADKELVNKIKEKVVSYDGILGVHDLELHNYGEGKCFASIHCEVDAKVDILVSHEIIDSIEKHFKDEENLQLVIHLDPIVTDDEKANAIRQKVDTLIKAVYPNFTTHDFRVVWGQKCTNIIFDVDMPFDEKESEERVREVICALVCSIDKEYTASITLDRI